MVTKAPVLKKRRESMSSTLKCFEAFELLAQEPYELPLAEIAARLAQPLTTAHRLLATLTEAGFVEQDAASRYYRLAGKALWAGSAYLRHSPVYHAAFLIMQETARECPGLVHLGSLHGNYVLYLHTVGSPSRLYLYADTGERRTLHATGLGKAILAWQPAEVLTRLTAQKLERFTKRTLTSPSELREELRLTRQRGYAIDDEEGVLGLRCVAAPILDRAGVSVAALSISAPVSVMAPGALEGFAAQIREAALKVSVQIGYRPASAMLAYHPKL